MQLIALNQDHLPVTAVAAKRHVDYLCPECLTRVRLRYGPILQPHFYHLEPPSSCRQNGKSLPHLKTQLHLQEQLPPDKSFLEHPFPSIGRIADLFWEEKNIIFEVQCSTISKEEAEARCRDYTSLGLYIVWILHTKQFNKKSLSAAEKFLTAEQTCYFTNINEKGQGVIFDQFDIVHRNKRLFCGPPLAIQHATVTMHSLQLPHQCLPQCIKEKNQMRRLIFQGDLLDRTSKTSSAALEGMLQLEKRFDRSSTVKTKKSLWGKCIDTYRALLYMLLEKHSH